MGEIDGQSVSLFFSEGNLSDFLTPRNFAERAEPLVKLGIPIIPLAYHSKEPITTNGVKSATLDPNTIESWSRHGHAQQPTNYNVGACAAYDGFWFLDDDAGTLHTLIDLPRTLKVKTSRGFHYYFKHDDWSRGQRYSQKENAVIDIPGFKGEARCNNQYVVAFGSIHPSGAVYELIDDVEPVAAPFELLQWLQQSYANSESRKGRLIKEEKKPLDPSKPHLLVKGPPPDEGFKALIEKVGTDPLRLYMNAHEDDRFHNPTLGNGADDYCPIPSHGPIRKEDYWTPCFGQVRGSDILHCLGCGWSGDVIKAIRDIYELPTMYEAARKICRDSGLDFEEFFPPPPPKSPQDEPDWDEIKKSEVEQEDKQTEKKRKTSP